MPFNVTLAVRPLAIGGGRCEEPPLLTSSDESSTCIAGCCSGAAGGGHCTCRESKFRGPLCNQELICRVFKGRVAPGLKGVCHSTVRDGDLVVCSCAQLGQIAVFAHRVLPSTNLHLFRADLVAAAGTRPQTVGLLLVAAMTYLVVAWIAFSLDQGALYYGRPPPWLEAGRDGWTFSRTFMLNLRTLQGVLRLFNVAPGYTGHTRLELVHCFAIYLVLSACAVLAFVGNRQCTSEQALSVAFLSAACSSLLTMLARQVFAWGRNVGTLSKALRRHTRERQWSPAPISTPRTLRVQASSVPPWRRAPPTARAL